MAWAVCVFLPLFAPAQQSTAAAVKAPGHETLEYAVEWRLVNAGRAKLTWNATSGSETAYESKLHLESMGLVSRLFHVNDDYTARLNENLCTENTFMIAREASRDRETRVVYDAGARRATFREHDLTKNTNVSAEVEIPECVHDIVGGLYHLRSLSLEPGKSIDVPVSDGKKTVLMKVACERRDDLKTPLGPRKTILYEVFAFNNVLYRRSGHLHVWLTDDARRVPVQIQIRLQFTIGTITLRLDKEEKT